MSQHLHTEVATLPHGDKKNLATHNQNIDTWRPHLFTVAVTVKQSSRNVFLVTAAFTHSDNSNYTHCNTTHTYTQC